MPKRKEDRPQLPDKRIIKEYQEKNAKGWFADLYRSRYFVGKGDGNHIDVVIISKSDPSFVKRIKIVPLARLYRKDNFPQYDYKYVTLKEDGWLYDKDVDFVAFEDYKTHMFVSRRALLDVVLNLVDFEDPAKSSVLAKLRPYTDEYEYMTFIPKDKLIDIQITI